MKDHILVHPKKILLIIMLLALTLVGYGQQKWSYGKVPPQLSWPRLNPAKDFRKGTKNNQVLMTLGDSTVRYVDPDTAATIIVKPTKYMTTLDTIEAYSNCPSLSIAKLDSCNTAYLYLFNCSTGDWELFKTPNIYTAGNTLFVDELSGNDETAKKGCPTCAWKTIDAALGSINDGDLLKIMPGNYTSSAQVAKGFNIDCGVGVNWNMTTQFVTGNTYTQPLVWNFDNLYHEGSRLDLFYVEELKHLVVNANTLNNIAIGGSSNTSSITIENCIDCFVSSNSSSGTKNIFTQFVKNVVATKNGFILSDNNHSNGAKSSLYYNNIVCDYNPQGNGMINYNYGSDIGIDKNYTLTIENIEFNPPAQYVTAPGLFDPGSAWGIPNASPNTIIGYARAGWTPGTIIDAKIRNFSGTGHGYGVDGSFGETVGRKYLYYQVKGSFKKGFPFFSRNMQAIHDATIVIDFDVECDEGVGCYIGVDNSDTHPTCKFVLRGRIKTNGKPCIVISGNSNNTVTLDNLTMVNVGGTYCIESNIDQNIIVKPGVCANLAPSGNITQLGSNIVVNSNYSN